MIYAIYALDKHDHLEVRKANRDAHLAHLEAQGERLIAAGPLLSDDGTDMVGSLLLLDFDDRAAVDTFCANDPYTKAGLFASVTIRPWRKVFPKG